MNPCLFIGGISDGAIFNVPLNSSVSKSSARGTYKTTPHDTYYAANLAIGGGETRRVFIVEGMTMAEAFDRVISIYSQNTIYPATTK